MIIAANCGIRAQIGPNQWDGDLICIDSYHRRELRDAPANRPMKNANAFPNESTRVFTLGVSGPQIESAIHAPRQTTVRNVIT